MSSICNSRNCINWPLFYFLKWGFLKSVRLKLRTNPDVYEIEITKRDLSQKKFLKSLFGTITKCNVSYKINPSRFYFRLNDKKILLNDFDIREIETLEPMINNSHLISIEHIDKDFFRIMFSGFRFYVRRRIASDINFLDENIAYGQYDFLQPFTKNGLVLDIGANIGDTAIRFCSRGAKKVFAYEPHPVFFEMAEKNIALNGFQDKVELFNFGIGSEDSIVSLKEDDPRGATGCFGEKEAVDGKVINIKILNFANMLINLPEIDVAKMDCEGAEFPAILACPKDILRKIKVFGIEFHREPESIVEYLRNSGYHVEIKSHNKDNVGLILAIRENLLRDKGNVGQ